MPAPTRRGRPPKAPEDRKVPFGVRLDQRLIKRLKRYADERFRGFVAPALESLIREGTPEIEGD